DARSSSPMNVSAAPDKPSAKASRRDSCRMNNSSRMVILERNQVPSRRDHSHGQLLVQIILEKRIFGRSTCLEIFSSASPSDSHESFCSHRLFPAHNETWRGSLREAYSRESVP